MLKTEDDFFEDLGIRESSGNYRAKNKQGFLGKYQMGEAAMVDAGYYKPKRNYNNDWTGEFTGKDGVYSVEDFLNNKQAQENAQKTFKQAQWRYLQNIGATKYLGQTINGIKITPAALLGGAHIGGHVKVGDYVRSGGKIDGKDANGVPVSEYMRKFQDYDVSGITGVRFENVLEKQDQKTIPWSIIPMAIPESLKQSSGVLTGQAINIDINQLAQFLSAQVQQSSPVLEKQSGLYGYTNPLTGSNHIYTREEVGSMSKDEFAQNEKEIDAQTRAFKGTMPTNRDLELESKTGGGVVYVNSYTRSDGTEVKGYYRSKPNF